jgi:hypothetical protein
VRINIYALKYLPANALYRERQKGGSRKRQGSQWGLLVIIKPIMLRKYFSQGAVWVGLDL